MEDPAYDGSGRGTRYEKMNQAQKVAALNALIAEWREPGFVRVKPARVIPDTTNREGTGVSAMHVHYIAVSMQMNGFTPRDHMTGKGMAVWLAMPMTRAMSVAMSSSNA